MTITLNGTTGITTDGGYTGDGISFVDGTPSNTLVTDTSGNVGIGGTPVSLASTKILTVTDATEARIQLQNTASGSTSADGVSLAINGTDFYVNNRENGNIITYVNGSERMRIDSSGNLLVGTTSNPTTLNGTGRINVLSTGDGFNIKQEGGGGGNHVFNVWSIGTTTNNAMAFYKGNTQTLVGSISTSTSSTAYNTSSDYRLKENIAPMTGALGVVQQLKPVTYTWKVDGSSGQGFIAHELQAVVPDCVTGEKDAVDADGKPVYQGIDTSFLVATLTAAIQELKAELDTVKTELATLKGTA